MMTMNYVEVLSEGFKKYVAVREKRPDLNKLLVPIFHEDGDMVDIFIKDIGNGILRLSDEGLTLMRLSYSYDIDSDTKDKVFRRILNENRLIEDDGNIFFETSAAHLYPAVLHFGQTIGKIASMSLYRREVITNMFYDMLENEVGSIKTLSPTKQHIPLDGREELSVDYAFLNDKLRVPVYLFGIKENDGLKIRNVAIACLEFQKKKMPFRSLVVHQNFSALKKPDQNIITNAVDKQFTSLNDFHNEGEGAILRLAA